MTIAYNGQANRLGAAFFVVSMMTLVFGGIASVVPLLRDLMRLRAARTWARAVGVGLLVAGLAFTGVAFTPENRAMRLHVDFTVWGWRVIAALSLLLGIAALQARGRYRRIGFVGLVGGGMLTIYAATFIWGPACCSTTAALHFHVVAQKSAAIVVVLTLIAMSREHDGLLPENHHGA